MGTARPRGLTRHAHNRQGDRASRRGMHGLFRFTERVAYPTTYPVCASLSVRHDSLHACTSWDVDITMMQHVTKIPTPPLRDEESRMFVELEGFEPSSKQGNHKLSTCLSLTSVFVQRQNQSHQPLPYPLKFSSTARGRRRLSPIWLHHLMGGLRSQSFPVMSCPSTWWRD